MENPSTVVRITDGMTYVCERYIALVIWDKQFEKLKKRSVCILIEL